MAAHSQINESCQYEHLKSEPGSRARNLWPPAVAGLFLLVWAAAPCCQGRFSWGFDLLQYYSLPFRIAWLATGLAAVVYVWSKGFPDILCRGFSRPAAMIAGLAAFSLLYLVFFARIPLLGDGFLRAKEISAGRFFSLTEPLTSLLHAVLYRALAGAEHSQAKAIMAYRIISIASGVAATAAYWMFSSKIGGRCSLPVFLILSFQGFNQLFYGYVESYALFIVISFGFLWAGAAAPRLGEGNSRDLTPALLCSLAISLHSSGVFLVPALIYFWWRKRFPPARIGMQALILLALPVSIMALGYFLSSHNLVKYLLGELPGRPYLPLWNGWRGLAIFSPGHWLDVFNQLLLASPAAIVLWLISAGPGTGPAQKSDKFLWVSFLSAMVFILSADPKLGAARDWDLFAWVSLPAVLLAVRASVERPAGFRSLSVVAVVSIWLFIPWLGVNASEHKSVARYLDILENDRRSSAYGYENLAIYYRQKSMPDKVEWVYARAVANEPEHPRMLYNYGLALTGNGRIEKGAEFFIKALLIDSTLSQAWYNLGGTLLQLNRPLAAKVALQKALTIDSSTADTWYNLGIACLYSDSLQTADRAFERALRNGISYGNKKYLYFYWGQVKDKLGQHELAGEYIKIAIAAGLPDSFLSMKYR
jgi:tetratricopeptide (TPR) repeat protein